MCNIPLKFFQDIAAHAADLYQKYVSLKSVVTSDSCWGKRGLNLDLRDRFLAAVNVCLILCLPVPDVMS